MPVYFVKTINDRNLVIEADQFQRIGNDYTFTNLVGEGNRPENVASVSAHDVFAIVEKDAFQGDFYFSDHEEDDAYVPVEESNPDSQSFRAAVVNIVDEYLSNEFSDPEDGVYKGCPECQTTAQEAASAQVASPKVEFRRAPSGRVQSGFVTPEGWVGFHEDSVEMAKIGARQYRDGARDWTYTPLNETTYIGDVYVG